MRLNAGEYFSSSRNVARSNFSKGFARQIFSRIDLEQLLYLIISIDVKITIRVKSGMIKILKLNATLF